MRGTLAKKLRRYVRETYPYMSEESLYEIQDVPRGVWRIGAQCQRALYQAMKKEYKRRRSNYVKVV